MRSKELDKFYSAESPKLWRQVVGEELHYHYALFTSGEESLQEGLRQAVKSLYREIPDGSSLFDAGCGWGGPARMLEKELNCKVKGITISRAQYSFCRSLGLEVVLGNLESIDLSGQCYDVVLMMESLEHIKRKENLLSKLRQITPKLILRVNCVRDLLTAAMSPPGQWQMYLETPQMIEHRLERAGWKVIYRKDRRPDSLHTFDLWLSQLNRAYPDSEPPGHLGLLKQLCLYAMLDLESWADANPLMEFVAQ